MKKASQYVEHTHSLTCTHVTSRSVCICSHTHSHTHPQAHTTSSTLSAFPFNSRPSLFNSHVVVGSLITLDNNLIKKRCPGIHCFSLATDPHLPVHPLCSPLHGLLSNAPPFYPLSASPSLSAGPCLCVSPLLSCLRPLSTAYPLLSPTPSSL